MLQSYLTVPEKHPEVARFINDRRGNIKAISKNFLATAKETDDVGEIDNLLSCLIESVFTGSVAEASLHTLIDRLHQPESSIADFLLATSCLMMAINSTINAEPDVLAKGREQILPWLHLQNITARILQTTGIVYERVVKHGGRAFCQVDEHGMIVYANPEMLRLVGRETIVNHSLAAFFDEHDRQVISAALAPGATTAPKVVGLNLTSVDGVRIPVGIELAPITIFGHYQGGYASMVDISGPMATMTQVMEQTPLGILRINTRNEITYANPRAREMSGAAGELKGHAIEELFPDKENLAKLEKEVQKRFKSGKSSEYPIEITRLDNGQRLPVMIAATPERDAKGTIIGSLAIIRSLDLERAAERINYHIATCLDTQELLQKFTEEIGKVCPFDRVSISVYSKKLHHVRSIFSAPKTTQRYRWWLLPPGVRQWIQNRDSDEILDLETFISRPEWQELQENSEVQALLQAKLFSIIRCPVLDIEDQQGSRLVASITFYRRGKNAFTEGDKTRLKSLPLVKTILATLHLEQKRKLSFRFNLIKKIFASCDDMKAVADLITSELVEFYGWNNVSIFRIDERDQVFRFYLLSQKAKDDDPNYLLPPEYKQRFDQGVLSYVYETGQAIFTGNVHGDENVKGHYLEGYKRESNSELCVPIMADGKAFWLMNIEDPQENAFSSDEVEELQVVLGEIGVILERAFQHHFLQEILEHTSDAIIVTDNAWKTRGANPAVGKLLGYSNAEMKSISLEKLFVKQGDWQWLIKGGQIPGQEIQLSHKNGTVLGAFLSTFELPQEVGGGTVLIARDLSLIKRLEELDFLGKLYYELAIQTKTPLSLLFSWIKRLQGEVSPADRQDTLAKALKQLRKLTLTYDRLVLYDKIGGFVPFQPLLIDISEILELLPGEFPESEWQKVVVNVEQEIPLLRADIFQLTFCIETIISYLLRTACEDGQVTINVSHHDGRIIVKLVGILPELPEAAVDIGTQASAHLTETISDMALGDNVIRAFVKNHQGAIYSRENKGDVSEYTIELKAAEERSLL